MHKSGCNRRQRKTATNFIATTTKVKADSNPTVLWILRMCLYQQYFSSTVSFSLILIRSFTCPCSHLLLPPPSLSPCLTLTVIRSWHLLHEPPPTVSLPCLIHYISIYSFTHFTSLSFSFFKSLFACCVCVSSHTVWCTRQGSSLQSHHVTLSVCSLGGFGSRKFSVWTPRVC